MPITGNGFSFFSMVQNANSQKSCTKQLNDNKNDSWWMERNSYKW